MKFVTATYFFLYLLLPLNALALDVNFSVFERSGVNREKAPVSYGIPLPANSNIFSTDRLGITGVEAQYKVLSRYDGLPEDTTKPIRVVLVDFQTNIDANSTKNFSLNDRGTGNAIGENIAIDEGDYISINTGSLSLNISKLSGNIFDQVIVGGKQIISHPTTDGFVVIYNGIEYSSHQERPTRVTIEENGPLRCVVKVDGFFSNSSKEKLIPPAARGGAIPDTPIRYTLRYIAYKNNSFIKLQATLKNENLGWSHINTIGTHNIKIQQAFLKTTLNGLATSKQIAIENFTENFSSGSYTLLQKEISDGSKPEYLWKYEFTKNGTTLKEGSQYDSFFDLRDSEKGLMVADRWFWQNHPNGISVNNNELIFNLWPNVGEDHRILGAIWKTHELIYYFHNADTDFSDELANLKKRLVAKCSDTYYAQTQFFTHLIPQEIKTDFKFPGGEDLNKAILAYNNAIRAKLDKNFITQANTYSIPDMRDGRMIPLKTNPTIYADWYGWLTFGGFPRWSNTWGYSNQHYDWAYIAFLGFLRYNDYSMLDFSEELVSHQADILVLHDPDAKENTLDYSYHGGQRYEQDALFSYKEDISISEQSAPMKFSHFWTNQLALQYLMTGDMRYFDAFNDCLEHCMREAKKQTSNETRNQTRAIAALVNGYWVFGNKNYLDEAWNTFMNGLYSRVTNFSLGEQYINAENFTPPEQRLGMDTMMIHAIVKLRDALISSGMLSEANFLDDFVLKWASHIKNSVYTLHTAGTPGTYQKNYTEYYTYNCYSNIYINTWEWVTTVPSVYISLTYSDLFAMAYDITKDLAWMNLARNVFKDAVVYPNVGWFLTAEQPATISGIWLTWGDSWAKAGQICTRGRYYLKTEWLFAPKALNVWY